MKNGLDWIRGALADRRVSIVSEKTGLHPNTIARIRDGKNQNPTLETLNKLGTYLIGEGE